MTPNPNGVCPKGFDDLDEAGDHCYKLFGEASLVADWGTAQLRCIKMGAELLSIHTDDVQRLLYEKAKHLGTDMWIGLAANGKVLVV